MSSQTYALATAGVTLHTENEQARDWADDFLAPLFSVGVDPALCSDSITVSYRDASPRDGEGAAQALFLRRRGCRWSHDGIDFVRDLDSGDLFEISDNTLVARYATEEPYFVRDAARLVRECVVDRLVRDGAWRLHAACAAVDGRGVLVVGGGGAGKSSTIAQLIASGAGFVANDRALMLPSPTGPVIHGVPIAVRWSRAQLSSFPGGAEFMAAYDLASVFKRTDAAAGFRKFELTPREVAAVTDRPLVPEIPLSAVVIADRDHSDRSSLSGVDAETGMAALLAALLASDPAFPAFFRRDDKTASTSAVQMPAGAVRWFRLSGSYLDPAAVSRLADAVADDHHPD